jgi:hypothetical protein
MNDKTWEEKKAEMQNKWAPVLENMGIKDEKKKDWLSQYAEHHSLNEKNFGEGAELGNQVATTPTDFSGNLLPVAMKVAAQTIGQDLVAVKPMKGVGGLSKEEQAKVDGELKRINRNSKLDTIMNDNEHKDREDLNEEEYEKIGVEKPITPIGKLMYLI